MRNDEELRRLIHEAADACLSGADAMPSRHDAIMKLFTALHMNFTELRNNIDNPNGKKKRLKKRRFHLRWCARLC